ncbi:MAG: hypothetical protein ACREBD_31430, partial [Blastocatellia bacterium]
HHHTAKHFTIEATAKEQSRFAAIAAETVIKSAKEYSIHSASLNKDATHHGRKPHDKLVL